MKPSITRRIFRQTPRAVGVAYALLISLFALDAWSVGGGFVEKLVAFLIHLLPTCLITMALIIAWKRPRMGGVAFLVLAAAFGLFFGPEETATLLLTVMAPALIGLLFLAGAYVGGVQLRPRT